MTREHLWRTLQRAASTLVSMPAASSRPGTSARVPKLHAEACATSSMTRRALISTVSIAARAAFAADPPVIVPIRRIMDAHSRCTPEQLGRFWKKTWPESLRDFGAGGIRLQVADAAGEIRRTAADRPVFVGLQRGVINLVLTGH